MIDMFGHIWKKLIVPSMKKVVTNSSDPYEEFGIPKGVSVPAAEDTPGMAFRKLPVEKRAAHERKMLEKKYLAKWGEYGIKSIDKKYAKTLDMWEEYYIDSYHKGIAPAVWTEPPEPKAVTIIKRKLERLAKGSLKKRSGAAAGSESDYDSDTSDTSSSDDDIYYREQFVVQRLVPRMDMAQAYRLTEGKQRRTEHYNRGVDLVDSGDEAGAMGAFRAAIAADPQYANAHNNLGNLLNMSGNEAGAEASYRRAITADPKLASAHYNLGNLLNERGDKAGAEAALRAAIAADPQHAHAKRNLKNILKVVKART
jgi:tetratricopeptide (TPR) repeat protein